MFCWLQFDTARQQLQCQESTTLQSFLPTIQVSSIPAALWHRGSRSSLFPFCVSSTERNLSLWRTGLWILFPKEALLGCMPFVPLKCIILEDPRVLPIIVDTMWAIFWINAFPCSTFRLRWDTGFSFLILMVKSSRQPIACQFTVTRGELPCNASKKHIRVCIRLTFDW